MMSAKTKSSDKDGYSSSLMGTYNQTLPDTLDDLTVFYDKWAQKYDEDYNLFGYNAPKVTVEKLAKYCPDKNIRLVEFGCGTGMVGDQLRANGYFNVDAVDMSPDSLKVCEEKKFYKSLHCAKIGADPLNIEADTYDALVTCGTFIPGHLNQSCFPEMVRVVKTGGYIILAMREEFTWTAKEYTNNQLEDAMQKMADDGKWEIVARDPYAGHFHDKPGLAFVFRVL